MRWLETNVPPLDKIAGVPAGARTSGGEVKQTIEALKPDRCARFLQIIADSSNWAPYEPSPGEVPEETEEVSSSTEPDSGRLAIQETLVRSILARNLNRIEPGLRRHPDFDDLEEVTFDWGGRLDLLCIDSKQRTTIVELQLGSLDDGHVGKVCRYFGWLGQNYPDVRIILLFGLRRRGCWTRIEGLYLGLSLRDSR